jgi:hypothetical protein
MQKVVVLFPARPTGGTARVVIGRHFTMKVLCQPSSVGYPPKYYEKKYIPFIIWQAGVDENGAI